MAKLYSSFTAFFIRSFIVLFFTTASLSGICQTGVLDVTFGDKGKVVTEIDTAIGDNYPSCMAIQKDEKILVGLYGTTIDVSLLKRFEKNGSVDSSFGKNGIVMISEKRYSSKVVAVQDDGKIILAGEVIIDTTYHSYTNARVALYRFKQDGSLDSLFGKNGYLSLNLDVLGSQVRAIKIKPDGKILLAGSISKSSNSTSLEDDYQVALFQLNENGTFDNTFGNAGKVYINFAEPTNFTFSSESFTSIAFLPGGKFITAGNVNYNYSSSEFVVVKWNSDGTVDNTFGENGVFKSDFGARHVESASIAIDDGLRIHISGTIVRGDSSSYIIMLRLNPDGTIDEAFGDEGYAVHFAEGVASVATSIHVRPNRKIIVTGALAFSETISGGTTNFLIAQFNQNGTLDSSFGKHGTVLTDFLTDYDLSNMSLFDSNSKLVLAGEVDDSEEIHYLTGLSRYDLNAPLYYNTIKGSIYLDKNKK